MRTPLDALIKTDGNREAFDRVISITETHEKPQKLFIVGPEDSGKTILLRARAMEKDLLSSKRVSYRPAWEMVSALRNNAWDGFFEEIGSFEVLFIDDFEEFFTDSEVGPMLCKLLLQERDQLGLDTVIASRAPLEDIDLKDFEGCLDDFETLEVALLDKEGRYELAYELEEAYRIEGKSPSLGEGVLEYIANELAESTSDIRSIMQHLMTNIIATENEVLDKDDVKKVLSQQAS